MPTKGCTVCGLEATPRKLLEALLRAKLPIREVCDFSEWYGAKNDLQTKITKSSLERHKNNGHFVLVETLSTAGPTAAEIMSLRDFAQEMFRRYQKANKDKIPSTKELIDLMLADSRLADLEARRRDEHELRLLLGGASYKSPVKTPENGTVVADAGEVESDSGDDVSDHEVRVPAEGPGLEDDPQDGDRRSTGNVPTAENGRTPSPGSTGE